MKRLLALGLLLAATPVVAQVGPMTPRMSCAQARALVAANGAIVLSTGPATYDRFVAHGGFCQFNEYAAPAYVPTRDTPQCPVGGVCREAERWRWR